MAAEYRVSAQEITPEERSVQGVRGRDEREGHRGEELPEAEAAADGDREGRPLGGLGPRLDDSSAGARRAASRQRTGLVAPGGASRSGAINRSSRLGRPLSQSTKNQKRR